MPVALAPDAGQRERFFKLVKDFGPRATLDGIEDPTLAGDRGEARFTISLSWRGEFGVARRKAGRFLAIVHRQDAGWQVDGASLIDPVP
jgi:hypothetical protein